jgi:hypothetical protein
MSETGHFGHCSAKQALEGNRIEISLKTEACAIIPPKGASE